MPQTEQRQAAAQFWRKILDQARIPPWIILPSTGPKSPGSRKNSVEAQLAQVVSRRLRERKYLHEDRIAQLRATLLAGSICDFHPDGERKNARQGQPNSFVPASRHPSCRIDQKHP